MTSATMTTTARRGGLARRIVASILIGWLGLRLISAWQAAQPDATWQSIKLAGVLRVGMDASFPPFADLVEGKIVGLDVDLANAIGQRLGLRIEIALVGYDGLYDALTTRQVDVIISALPFDPMRGGEFLYTTAYLDAGQYLVSTTDTCTAMAQIDGRSVALEYGSLGDDEARRWERRLHQLTILRFATAAEALQAVQRGAADCALVDFVSARVARRSARTLIITPPPVVSEGYHVATRSRSADLAGAIQAAINALQADGSITALLDKWL